MISKKHLLALILVIWIVCVIPSRVFSYDIDLTISPTKTPYNISENVVIAGNLTRDGIVATDALVALEVDDPSGALFAVRTVKTGNISNATWPVETQSIVPVDGAGNPKYSFNAGGEIRFKITMTNNAANPNHIVVVLTLMYTNAVPFYSSVPFEGDINPGQPLAFTTAPFGLPAAAIPGNATAYASVYDKLPRENGLPYSPEVSAQFIIGTSSTRTPTFTVQSGHFTMTIPLTSVTLWIGNYDVYASSYYALVPIVGSTQFTVVLLGDIYHDNSITMRDIAIIAKAFNSKPGDPLWNPIADLNHDNTVNMVDIAITARNFGVQVRSL